MSLKHRLQAGADLIKRYRRGFTYAWQHRQELTGKVLTADEAEFLPAALSLQARPVSPTARVLGAVLVLIVVTLLLWSIVGRMDIIVNASGKLIPTGNTKTIASAEVAIARALYVREGQAVKTGDTLIELDASALEAERERAGAERVSALLQAARAQALIEALAQERPPRLAPVKEASATQMSLAHAHAQGQYLDFVARSKRIESEIARLNAVLPLAAQRATDYSVLLEARDVAHHAWLEKEQARVELTGQMTEAIAQRTALIAETRRQAYEQLTEGLRAAEIAWQDEVRAAARSRQLRLVAPVDGTVQQLTVHTVGSAVPAAQPLMQIVPREHGVEVEAFIENKDVGFVHLGQPAKVKVEAFDYTKYGTITGTVSQISRDAIQDEKRGLLYAVRISLERTSIMVNGKEMILGAGMSSSIEIKTGDRRVIEYVLSPLIRYKQESLNER